MRYSMPLVSVITPCFNGAATVHRMIESVLAQTYPCIEYILVNDGSTDNTEEIVQSYADKFTDRGYIFKYVKQQNMGLGGAINTGLKNFTGEYLCWADADDFYAAESIEKRVLWMEEHPDYGIVTSDAYVVKEGDFLHPVKKVSQGVTDNENENQFWNMLSANTIFCCACHMIRASDFLRLNPDREIYPARRGQNWQMLLPMYYHYKRHFMEEPLFYYVISDNSMSHDSTAEQELWRCNEHEDILAHVLQGMDMSEEDRLKAKKIVKVNYAAKRLYVAYRAGIGPVAEEQLQVLKTEKKLTFRDRLYYIGAKHPRIKKLLKHF